MMVHGDGKQKAAGAALFALSLAAAATNQNRNVGVSQPQVIRVRDRIQFQRNIPVVAVRGYAQYQPEDGFQFELQNKSSFDKRQSGGATRRISASTAGAWRCTASDDRPSPTTSARSHPPPAARSSASALPASSRRPRSGRIR